MDSHLPRYYKCIRMCMFVCVCIYVCIHECFLEFSIIEIVIDKYCIKWPPQFDSPC